MKVNGNPDVNIYYVKKNIRYIPYILYYKFSEVLWNLTFVFQFFFLYMLYLFLSFYSSTAHINFYCMLNSILHILFVFLCSTKKEINMIWNNIRLSK